MNCTSIVSDTTRFTTSTTQAAYFQFPEIALSIFTGTPLAPTTFYIQPHTFKNYYLPSKELKAFNFSLEVCGHETWHHTYPDRFLEIAVKPNNTEDTFDYVQIDDLFTLMTNTTTCNTTYNKSMCQDSACLTLYDNPNVFEINATHLTINKLNPVPPAVYYIGVLALNLTYMTVPIDFSICGFEEVIKPNRLSLFKNLEVDTEIDLTLFLDSDYPLKCPVVEYSLVVDEASSQAVTDTDFLKAFEVVNSTLKVTVSEITEEEVQVYIMAKTDSEKVNWKTLLFESEAVSAFVNTPPVFEEYPVVAEDVFTVFREREVESEEEEQDKEDGGKGNQGKSNNGKGN